MARYRPGDPLLPFGPETAATRGSIRRAGRKGIEHDRADAAQLGRS